MKPKLPQPPQTPPGPTVQCPATYPLPLRYDGDTWPPGTIHCGQTLGHLGKHAGSPAPAWDDSPIKLPIPILLWCPECGTRHIDGLDKSTGIDWATRPHKTHECIECGHNWAPARAHTVGVRFLPGYKNDGAP